MALRARDVNINPADQNGSKIPRPPMAGHKKGSKRVVPVAHEETKRRALKSVDKNLKDRTDDSTKSKLPRKISMNADAKQSTNMCDSDTVSKTSFNFDAECFGDPFSVHEFSCDVFEYYKSREKVFRVGDYMSEQKRINKTHRAALVDWLVELQEFFELTHETLYLSIKVIDLYLSMVPVRISRLQVLACAALFIASKFEELSPPLIDDFVYIVEDAFDRTTLIETEREVIRVVGFDIGCPLSYAFIRRYGRVCKADMATLTLARYILEMSLMFYEFVGVSESRMASAAFLLATRMKKLDAKWTPTLVRYTGYELSDVEPLMWQLNHMLHIWRKTTMAKLDRIQKKYGSEVFFHSTKVPLLEDQFSVDSPVTIPSGQGFDQSITTI